MIELTHASFQYENSDRGVQDISILVKSGECVVLTGLSGCGKTTVTRLANGLAPSYYPGAFSGSVRIDGKDISALSTWEIGCLVGSVFQDPKSQFFSSELAGEVAFPCENYGLSAREIRARTDAAIEALKLSHLKDRAVDVLSSGEKQRAAIASVKNFVSSWAFSLQSASQRWLQCSRRRRRRRSKPAVKRFYPLNRQK